MKRTIGIVGARGHTGAELIRLVAAHPGFELAFVSSRELAGQPVRDHVAGYDGALRYENLSHEDVAANGADAVVLAVEVGHRKGEMAVAVAWRIWLLAALVDGELELEPAFGIAHVDERESLEIEPLGDLQPEGLTIEIDGTGLVENPDHGMNCLCQSPSPFQSMVRIMRQPPGGWWQPVTTPSKARLWHESAIVRRCFWHNNAKTSCRSCASRR